MRAFWISTLLLLGGCGSAFSQSVASHDVPNAPTHKGAPSPYISPEPSMNWSGLYAGAHVGGSFNSGLSGLAGGRAGYNYQFDQSVVGVEGALSYRSYSASSTTTATDAAGSTYNVVGSGKANAISTLTARYGYVYDRSTLMFVSGGVAADGYAMSHALTALSGANLGASGANSARGIRYGWALGIGFEYALTRNWSLSGHYQYYRLTTSSLTTSAKLGGATTLTSTFSFPESGGLASLGINYHF